MTLPDQSEPHEPTVQDDGPEPIHAAYTIRRELTGGWFWPAAFMWASLAYCAYVLVRIFMGSLGLDPRIAEFAAAAGLVMWGIQRVRSWRSNPTAPSWARARDGLSSDPSHRLRLVGEGASINRIAAQIETIGDRFTEPLITRTALGISVADDRVDSFGNARPGHVGLFSRTSGLVRPDLSAAQKATGIVGAIGSVVAVFQGTVHLFGVLQPFGPLIGFTGVTGGIVLLGLLCPTYIRVAPGSLDILRFGWIGRGIPRFEHFDLRTCQVLVDSRTGMIRLWDESRATRRGLFINGSMTGAGKLELAKAVLAAARSRIPTPSLPDDALVG
jgi:hypothetical protein